MKLLFAMALTASGSLAAQSAPTVVLANVTVIDGRGGPAVANQSITIRNGRIASIGPASATKPPVGAEVLDLAGKTVIPGLIDTHLHGPPDSAKVAARLAYLFRNGITSARDMAGDSYVFRQVAQVAADPKMPMAQLYYVAFWAGPSFYQADKRPIGSTQGKPVGTVPWFQSIDAGSDLDRSAQEAAALGAYALKLYSDLPLPIFKGAVTAAHRHGIRAVSHVAVFPIRPRDVIASGVDGVSHSALLVWEAADSVPGRFHRAPNTNFGPVGPYAKVAFDDARIVAVLREMKRRGTILDATVSAIEKGISPEASAWSLKATGLAKRLGVTVSAGTDHPEEPSATRQPALFDEIELLVTGAGFTPLEAVTAATLNGAKALGIEKDRGTIEKGKIADLVVLDADPSTEIRNLRRVHLVFKAGERPAR